jgi:hypothetical protein
VTDDDDDDDDDGEIVCENFRRRNRLMDRLVAPFDFIELLAGICAVIGTIAWLLRVR